MSTITVHVQVEATARLGLYSQNFRIQTGDNIQETGGLGKIALKLKLLRMNPNAM